MAIACGAERLEGRTVRVPDGSRLEDYDYRLPPELIAQRRSAGGGRSRLLVADRTASTLTVTTFGELDRWLRPGDCLVRNDTRVLAARLRAIRTRLVRLGPVEASPIEVEILLCHSTGGGLWECLARPAKRLRTGDDVAFPDGTRARVEAEGDDGARSIRFSEDAAAFACMARVGEMPLPPYVHTAIGDAGEYQTAYAARPGAVAAPTAGFHFSLEDFERLRSGGVEIVDVTLHVGPGTFQPIRVEELSRHVMHRERFEIAPAARESIERARRDGRRIVALGTTTVRVLESLDEPAAESSGWTGLFIRPGHRFRRVDALITNFHLPGTSLLVLVSAFAGRELIRNAYERAVEEQFLFYSFGDGMLIV